MQLGTYRGRGGEMVTLLKEIILRRPAYDGSMIAIFMDCGEEIAMSTMDFQEYFKKVDDVTEEVKESVIDVLMDMRDLLGEISNDIAEIKYNTPNTR